MSSYNEKDLFEDDENKIYLNTTDNKFYVCEKKKDAEVYDFEELEKFDTFLEAEKWLKRRKDKKVKGILKKKKPLKALGCLDYDDDYSKVNITSIDPTGYGVYCWISNGKDRCKNDVTSLLKDTEKNELIIKEIKELEGKIKALNEKRVFWSGDEVKEYFKDD